MYNPQIQQPQYYQQLYGPSSSTMGSPYYYGYSVQAPRGTFSTPQPNRIPAGPSYLYYPTPMEASFSAYRPPPQLQQLPIRPTPPSPSGTIPFLFSTKLISFKLSNNTFSNKKIALLMHVLLILTLVTLLILDILNYYFICM